MNAHNFDPFRPGTSPLHKLDVRVKLITLFISMLGVAVIPAGVWPIYAVFFAFSLGVIFLSGLGFRFFWSRAIFVLPFLMSAAPVLITGEGQLWRTIDLGYIYLPITFEGVERFTSIALKAWISVHFAIALVSSTPFPHILYSLRVIGVPQVLVSVIGLMWRYLFIFTDEATRLKRARDARCSLPHGTVYSHSNIIWSAKVAGGMVGNLLLRAFDRADRVYTAMLSRGYDGTPKLLELTPLKLWHWFLLSGVALCFSLLLFLSFYLK